jgi:hypothetical protein
VLSEYSCKRSGNFAGHFFVMGKSERPLMKISGADRSLIVEARWRGFNLQSVWVERRIAL